MLGAVRATLPLLLLAAAVPVDAWISISQSRFGAKPEDIAKSMRGVVAAGTTPQALLGNICARRVTFGLPSLRSSLSSHPWRHPLLRVHILTDGLSLSRLSPSRVVS